MGIMSGSMDAVANCGEDDAAVVGVVGKLKEAADAAAKRSDEKDAVVDQVARETAAATELQRGMAECAAEHAKLATVLREKFPDQDWSAFAPAPQPAKK